MDYTHDMQDSFDSKATPIKEPSVKAYHTFNDMRFFNFPLANGTQVQTCPAALGYGFAAGTSDWPGPLDFTQGANSTMGQNPLWAVVSGVLSTPTPQQKAVCLLIYPYLTVYDLKRLTTQIVSRTKTNFVECRAFGISICMVTQHS